MKLRGGYNIPLAGRPASEVQVVGEPHALHLPRHSRRLHFSALRVADGSQVRQGETLAVDPDHYNVPLLAPRGGTVRLEADGEVITLTDVVQEEESPYEPAEEAEHVSRLPGPAAARRQRLVDLGAWQFLCDAHTGDLPDPFGAPRAVIVSTANLEPFSARGDVQLSRQLPAFTRGLEHLQGLLEYQPIYLAVPQVRSDLATKVRQTVRGYARVEVVLIPRKYPFDNFALLARRLGLKRDGAESVWAVRTEGVLAMDWALTASRPCTARIVAVGGPGVDRPTHVKAMAGYPIGDILAFCGRGENVRVLSGGALTGDLIRDDQAGLDAECLALTVLPDEPQREFLGFGRPGWKTQSFSRCYLSALRRPFHEPLRTELRGERRACVGCGYCQDVCPAGIWPHLVHKYLYADDLDEAERAGIDLCVRCGLCSYVCMSKIELMQQFIEAQHAIEQERIEAEREAKQQAEAEAKRREAAAAKAEEGS